MARGVFRSPILVPLVCAALAALELGCVADGDSHRAEIDAVFAGYDRPDSPGCALGVIRDGELVYKRGYGMASLEHGLAITPETVFRTGSVSKQFTAAAVALLAEEGKLSLDDEVRKYLPELPAYGHPITIRHLIHHTSGLRDYTALADLAGIDGADHYTVSQALDLIARQRAPDFAAGEKYSYCNSGYFLLSQIVERASGRSLRTYSEERIFAPLGMARTHFHDDPFEVVARRAHGYSPSGEKGFRIDMTGWEQVGDGGIFTTLEDLLLWDRNFYSNRLGRGGPALIDTLQTTGRLNDGRSIDYAFGLVVDKYRGLQRVSHGGSWVGFRAHITRFPEQRFSVAVLCNLSTATPGDFARRVADIYLGDEFKEEEAEKRAGGGPTGGLEPVGIPEEALRGYAGHYQSGGGTRLMELVLDEGRLIYRDGSGDESPLLAIGGGRFAVQEVEGTEVIFPEAAEGAIRRVIVRSEGDGEIAYEAFEPASPPAATLDEYTGSYDCEELDARYTVTREDRQLAFSVGHLAGQPLAPLFPDVFHYQARGVFTFGRGEDGRVERLSLDVEGVGRLECTRLRT